MNQQSVEVEGLRHLTSTAKIPIRPSTAHIESQHVKDRSLPALLTQPCQSVQTERAQIEHERQRGYPLVYICHRLGVHRVGHEGQRRYKGHGPGVPLKGRAPQKRRPQRKGEEPVEQERVEYMERDIKYMVPGKAQAVQAVVRRKGAEPHEPAHEETVVLVPACV